MRNLSKPPQVVTTLQGLLDSEGIISQSLLNEYRLKREALDAAREDFRAMASELCELMTLGCPVESGPLHAEFEDDGTITIEWGRR